jgi:formylglycine-generating enzyme
VSQLARDPRRAERFVYPLRPRMVSPTKARALLAVLAAAAVPAAGAAQAPRCPPGMQGLTGGRFTLGDGSAAVEVRAFCLDRTEVTVAAYAACARAGRCEDAGLDCGSSATYRRKDGGDLPVNCVTWFEAERFCAARGRRLPTEAEWEWAARGRERATTYPWGEAAPASRACWDGTGNSEGKGGRRLPCPVATHPGADSPDGFADLGGNVREWTASPYERFRVLRGGSWGDSLPSFLSAAFRGMNAPDERMELLGFRCAADSIPGDAVLTATAATPRAPPPPPATKATRGPAAVVVPLRIELP